MKHYFLPLIPLGLLFCCSPMTGLLMTGICMVIGIVSYTLRADKNYKMDCDSRRKAWQELNTINGLKLKTKSFLPILHDNGFKVSHDDFFYRLDSRKINFTFSYHKQKKVLSMQGSPDWMEPGLFVMSADYFSILEKKDHLYGDELLYDRMLEENAQYLKRSWLIPYRLLGYVSIVATLAAISDRPDYPSYFVAGLFCSIIYMAYDIY